MSLLIAVCLLLLSSSSDSNHYGADHHHPQAVPGRYPPRYDPVTACEDHHIMPENTEELPPIADTVLSTEDVLILTLKHCNDILESERTHTRDTLKAERDHTTYKIGQIIESQETINKALHSRIQDLEASDKNQQQILKRIVNLEQKIETTTKTVNTALEILEEAIANVNLKTQTKILYQEKLLYNLKQALFDTLSTIRNDKCASSATLQTTECEPSDKPSPHPSTPPSPHPSTPPSPPEHAELNRDPTVIQHEEYETPIEVEEVLPQIDGNDSIEEDIIDITDSASLCAPFTFDPPPDSVSLPPNRTSSSRTARFTLNKEKQVLSLGADTKLADFDNS